MSREKISNPLTIVGIFAGTAEIAGTTVIAFLPSNLQAVFIWYVMGFPILLVILFFITWNFNSTVLYSPSDYQNEENYLTIQARRYMSKMDADINELEKIIEGAKKEIVSQTVKEVSKNNTTNPAYIEKIIDVKMKEISVKLNETKNNSSEYADLTVKHAKSSARLIGELSKYDRLNLKELSNLTAMTMPAVIRALDSLIKSGIVIVETIDNKKTYKMNANVEIDLSRPAGNVI